MNQAVRNAMRFGGLSLQDAVRLATVNPARLLGLSHRLGRIARGCDANLVLVDRDCRVWGTIVEGRWAYRRASLKVEPRS